MADAYLAHEWLAANGKECEKFAGKWVAVSETGIVDSSDSFKELMQRVDRLSDPKLLITQIPTADDALFILPVTA